jgi:hypothetical protein
VNSFSVLKTVEIQTYTNSSNKLRVSNLVSDFPYEILTDLLSI